VAKVRADQLLTLFTEMAVQVKFGLHLLVALQEHAPRLPVALLEILGHQRELGLAGTHIHGQNRRDDAMGPR